jgi:hypothetical protein
MHARNIFLKALGAAHALALAAAAMSYVDKANLSLLYSEGSVKLLEKKLDSVQAAEPQMTREDSVFINKHLGVIHSNDPEKKQLGVEYFCKLLRQVPTEELKDMYMDGSIDSLFRTLKGAIPGDARSCPEIAATFFAKNPEKKPDARAAKDTLISNAKAPAAATSVSTSNPDRPASRNETARVSGNGNAKAWIWGGVGVVGALGLAGLYFGIASAEQGKTVHYVAQ